MQVVAAVILRGELAGDLRVSEKFVKVDDGIKHAAGAYEFVDALSRFFSLGAGVGLSGKVCGRAKGRDGSAEDRDAVRMDERHHLLVGLYETFVDFILGFGCRLCDANVVDAFKDHGVLDAWVGENVTVDAAKGIGTETIGKDTVSAGGKVADGDVLCGRVLL